jgi:hypothetical protein
MTTPPPSPPPLPSGETIIRPAWVRQEDERGCGPACFAMLTNRTYAGAVSMLRGKFERQGISHFELDQYLAEEGYAVARRYLRVAGADRKAWPVAPFADVHLCQVRTAGGGHFVLMLRDGTVLDPLDPTPTRLDAYVQVDNIAAVVSLGGCE